MRQFLKISRDFPGGQDSVLQRQGALGDLYLATRIPHATLGSQKRKRKKKTPADSNVQSALRIKSFKLS